MLYKIALSHTDKWCPLWETFKLTLWKYINSPMSYSMQVHAGVLEVCSPSIGTITIALVIWITYESLPFVVRISASIIRKLSDWTSFEGRRQNTRTREHVCRNLTSSAEFLKHACNTKGLGCSSCLKNKYMREEKGRKENSRDNSVICH